jgi:hypothetical protein
MAVNYKELYRIQEYSVDAKKVITKAFEAAEVAAAAANNVGITDNTTSVSCSTVSAQRARQMIIRLTSPRTGRAIAGISKKSPSCAMPHRQW